MTAAEGNRSTEVLAFLQKDYEMKVRFLENHVGRMWTPPSRGAVVPSRRRPRRRAG